MTKPNLLIFMTDQQRGSTVCGEETIVRPNLDRFRREGVTFANAFCSAPHCCPSRATFFSGVYPTLHGVWNNVQVANALSPGLSKGVRLWSEDLRDSGYALFFSGKWHVSNCEGPKDRGWQEGRVTGEPHYGLDWEREWEQYRRVAEAEHSAGKGAAAQRAEGQIVRPGYGSYTHYGCAENPHGDAEVLESARQQLRAAAAGDQPWCVYAGTLGPHDPYYAPQRFLDLYPLEDIELPANFHDRMADKPGLYRRTRARFDQLSEREHREALRHYRAFCSYQDGLFGQLLEELEATGQAQNTLVLYCSDHGDYAGEHGLWCKGLPCFRGAYHIPAVIRWPAGVQEPGRVVEDFVTLADFAPTFLELAGGVPERKFAGESLLPFLQARAPEIWRDAVFTQSNGNELYGIQRSVMTRDWKYVYNGFDFDELYDLQADPGETCNRIDDPACRPIVQDLCRRMWQFAYEQHDTATNPYIMVSLAPYGPAVSFS